MMNIYDLAMIYSGPITAFTFLFLVLLFVFNLETFFKLFKRISRKSLLVLLLIFILAIQLRLNYKSCESNTLWEYVLDSSRIIEGKPTSIDHPEGYSLLLSLLSLFKDLDYNKILYFNVFLSSLTVLPIFLITYLLVKDKSTSLVSSLIYAILPASIITTSWIVPETISLFFVSFSFFLLLVSLKVKRKELILLTLLSLVFSISVRPENVMFIPVFLISYLLFLDDLNKLKLPLIVFSVFMLQFLHIFLGGRELYGYDSMDPHSKILFSKYYQSLRFPPTFSLKYLPMNMKVSIDALRNSIFYPSFMFPLAFFSSLLVIKKRELIIIFLWIVTFLLFFGSWIMFFINNAYLYQVLLHVPLSILAAIGIHNVIKTFHRNLKVNICYFIYLSCLLLILLSSNFSYAKREEHECLSRDILKVSQLLDKNSCILIDEFYLAPEWSFSTHVKFLLKDRIVLSEMKKCPYGRYYYLKPDQEIVKKFSMRNDGQSNATLKYITKNCRLSIVNKTTLITVFEVVC